MQVITREVELLRGYRVIQNGQNFLYRFREIGPNAATIVIFVKPPETSMLKALIIEYTL